MIQRFLLVLLILHPIAFGSEINPGGLGTARVKDDRKSFRHPMPTLNFDQRGDFFLGRALFRRPWVSAPASTKASDGLGPLFDARSCSACHINNGRGRPRQNSADHHGQSMVLRLFRRHPLQSAGDPIYGKQLQSQSLPGIPVEGQVRIATRMYQGGEGDPARLSLPVYQLAGLNYGPLGRGTIISPRIAPPVIGLGLLEEIPTEMLVAKHDPEDRDGDGISGRANWVEDLATGRRALGRFGWTAEHPTVDQQIQAAFFHDMGMSVPLFPAGAGDCTIHQQPCLLLPTGNSPDYDNLEVAPAFLEKLVFYTKSLAVPYRPKANDSLALAGKLVFQRIACDGCHTPRYEIPAARSHTRQDQEIWPYTDLLLHDLGLAMGNQTIDGSLVRAEWRTAPLWGLGRTKTVGGHWHLLHDGRAKSLDEAIRWHGGEGQRSRQAYLGLTKADRAALLYFLESL